MFKFLSKIKIPLLLFIDTVAVIIAYLFSYYLVGAHQINEYFFNILSAIVLYILIMLILGIYRHIIRYSSVREYSICIIASTISCGIMTVLSFSVNRDINGIKYNIIAGIIVSMLFIVGRVSIRQILGNIKNNKFSALKKSEKTKVLVIGAGSAGCLVVKDIIKAYSDTYNIVGIIDDDKNKKNGTICGVKVLGSRLDISTVCEEKDVELILYCIPSLSGQEKKNILDICYNTGKKIKILPGINDLIIGKSMFKSLRDIDVTDLMPREEVILDDKAINEYISNKVVLVTGGGGSIGSELCRQIAKFNPKKLIILDIYENNIYDIECELNTYFPELKKSMVIASVRDSERLKEIFNKYRPQIVLHAAAHKHVPLMESNYVEAIKNNVFGTLNVAECADEFSVDKFILISTDKAVNPTNIMGATKRICEMIIQALNEKSETDYVAVRFGNVLGSNGSVIPLFKKQIAAGGPVTVTHKEITRFFMTIPEAAQLVLQAGTYAKGGEIFVLDMGKPVRIYDLAVNMIKLSGLVPEKDIEIKISGLRPGEKLYEELLMSEEGLMSTKNKKIFVAQPMHIDYNSLKQKLENLLNMAKDNNDAISLKNAIAEIVTTYMPPEKINNTLNKNIIN